MAHTIQLSAQINCSARPLRWTRGRAEYIGWTDQAYDGPKGVYRITEPKEYAGVTQAFLRNKMYTTEHASRVPLRSPKKCSEKIRQDPHPLLVDMLISDHHVPQRPYARPVSEQKSFDGWQMRTDFLRVGNDLNALTAFLSKYGEWGNRTSPISFFGEGYEERLSPRLVQPDEILFVTDYSEPASGDFKKLLNQRWRLVPLDAVIRWGLTCEPADWFASRFPKISLAGPKDTFPHLEAHPRDCYDALFATVTFDHLRGTRHRVCARPDCGFPFALESKHQRLYCCQYCAHLESVRRSRRAPRTKKLRG